MRQVQGVRNEAEQLGNVHFTLEWLLDIVTRHSQTNLIDREVVDLLSEALINLTEVCDTATNNIEVEAVGVNESTVQRRLRRFDLSVKGTYSTLTDQELDSLVQEILTAQPNTGNKGMTG